MCTFPCRLVCLHNKGHVEGTLSVLSISGYPHIQAVLRPIKGHLHFRSAYLSLNQAPCPDPPLTLRLLESRTELKPPPPPPTTDERHRTDISWEGVARKAE